MKTIKPVIIILLLIFSISTFSQDYNFISKDLHLMSDKEMIDNQVQITADTPMFDEKGNNIESSQINDLMSSGNFFPLIYGNNSYKAKAVIFRKSTEEEKKQFLQALQMQDPNANFTPGQKAKDFIAYDINGNKIELSKLKGKIVVLNFWFPQCKPCVKEMPELNKLTKKYTKNVVFISVTFEKKQVVKSFLSTRDFNYTQITDNESILSDYHVSAFPTHIIIDKNGEIIMNKVGDFVKELDEKIGLLLNQ